MKRFLKYIFISLLLLSSRYGQSQKLDSLWSVYNSKTQADTNRLKAISAIAWSYISNNPDTAIILAREELQLANSLPLGKGKGWVAKALSTIGISFNNKGNHPKALEYDLKSFKIYEQIGNKKGIAACYTNIGIVYLNQSDYSKALEYYLKALTIRKEIGDKLGTGSCYTNIGNVYINQSEYSKAL